MRVLYTIDSLVAGGAESSLVAVAAPLVASGLELDVAYLKERPGLHEELIHAGANVFSVAGPAGRAGRTYRMHQLIAARRPDLIHTTLFEADITGRLAGRLAGVPIVSSLVGLPYGEEHLEDPRLIAWRVHAAHVVDAISAQVVVRFHAVTQHVADVMSRRLLLRRDRIDVIPRGRDPNVLGIRSTERSERARADVGIGAREKMVLAVAHHEYSKGLDLLLEAFPKLLALVPSARLVVAGRETEHTRVLRATVNRLDLDGAVRFLGSRSDVPELLSAADVFVLPSRREGTAGVLLEAMALEAPIVANDLPAVREVVRDRVEGRLVSCRQHLVLASCLAETLLDAAAARARARNARARFLAGYTSSSVAKAMMGFYERSVHVA
jgi:glycosyltransferase involved in cell wall biosynthesis